MIIIVSKYAPPDHSGAGRRMYSFFNYLKETGYDVRFITTTQRDEDKVIVIQSNPVEKYFWKLSPAFNFLSSFLQLVYRSLTGSFPVSDGIRSVWLVSASPLTAAAAAFFRLRGYRIITQNVLMHSDNPGRRPTGVLNIAHKLREFQYSLTDVVTSNSPGLYEQSNKHHPNCVLIPNPVELPKIENIKKNRNGTNVLIVGRLSHRKGTDIVFRTIDIIHRKNPGINFTFVGPDDDMDDRLCKIYDSCRHINRDNVHFAGYQIDTRPWYAKADIFFLPSRNEGFPSVFIEAMSHGVPLVVKKLEGVTDFIIENGYPAIIDSEEPENFSEAIIKLVYDKELYGSLVKRLKNNVKHFDKKNIYNQYINLIEK